MLINFSSPKTMDNLITLISQHNYSNVQLKIAHSSLLLFKNCIVRLFFEFTRCIVIMYIVIQRIFSN